MLDSSDIQTVLDIINSIGASIFVVDVLEDGGFRYFAINHHEEDDMGMTNSYISGKRPEEILNPKHAERVSNNYQRCVESRDSIECLDFIEAPTGTRWARNHLAPIYDENGRIVRIIGTAIEITEEIKAQTEKRKLEEALQDAMTKVLSGYIPICAGCKAIRTDQEEWVSIEKYVHDRTAADFTHTLCPKCFIKYTPSNSVQSIQSDE